jgi:hypothetical protein
VNAAFLFETFVLVISLDFSISDAAIVTVQRPLVSLTLSELRSKNGVRDAKRDAMDFSHVGFQQLQKLPGVLTVLMLSQARLIHSHLLLTCHALVRS